MRNDPAPSPFILFGVHAPLRPRSTSETLFSDTLTDLLARRVPFKIVQLKSHEAEHPAFLVSAEQEELVIEYLAKAHQQTYWFVDANRGVSLRWREAPGLPTPTPTAEFIETVDPNAEPPVGGFLVVDGPNQYVVKPLAYALKKEGE